MRNILIIGLLLISNLTYSQTNTFPSTGNVGIGTTSPDKPLVVKSQNGNSEMRILTPDNVSKSAIYFGDTEHYSKGQINYYHNRDEFGFWTSAVMRMCINSSGNVGIGTMEPLVRFHVQNGSSGRAWSPITGTTALFESSQGSRSFIGIIGKSTAQSEVWFGDEELQNSGRIRYEHDTDGFEFWTNGGNKMTLNSSGKLGLGTTSPIGYLNVIGSGTIGSNWNSRSNSILSLTESGGGGLFFDSNEIQCWNSQGEGNNLFVQSSANAGNTYLNRNAGNVGIGTDSPDYKLDVLGTIRANEVKVATGWSDFVFEPDYDLKPLDQVEEFITENGHLPDIPSAEEVEENGISLGKMDAKLLQKIEELTLYVIEQQKELNELKKENEELKTENQTIKTDLLKEIETIKAQLK